MDSLQVVPLMPQIRFSPIRLLTIAYIFVSNFVLILLLIHFIFPGDLSAVILKSFQPPAPKKTPGYEDIRKWESALPQHNLDLPFPEGRTGRYVKFSNQIQQLGWNNVLNEM